MVGTLGIVQPAFGDANPTVSISSPSTGTTAKGKLAISTRFAADPSGTATINDIGISIANAPVNYTGTLTLNGVTAGSGILGTTNVDAYWSDQYWSGSSATFYVDTTSWPAGSYSIAVTVLDTNNRSATSTPVVFSTANANPTVSISSPPTGTTAKGKLAISTRFAVVPVGGDEIDTVLWALDRWFLR